VIVEHPEAMRWGFQITAREVSDETKQAGTFQTSGEVQVICANASPAPCGGSVAEFAEHTAAATTTGQNGRKVFNVEWTPPASEVGRIIFYAAGNAANNDGTNAGDRIYTTSAEVLAQGSCALSQRPTLRTVVSSASFQPGIGLNSMITIFGSGFGVPGRRRSAGSGDFVNGNFPNQLGCVAVEINGARVPVTFVQTDQINAQAPTLNVNGPVTATVIQNPGTPQELRSDVASGIQFATYAPALFTFNGTSIAAQHVDFTPLANTSVVPSGRPARPGDVVILYGTGFGITEPVYQAGELPHGPATIRDRLTVTIGGITLTEADVLYAGLAGQSISGLFQFNLRLPQSLSAGDVPVVIRIGGVQTQANATIPIIQSQ
jgi:uncharacterized protein (TIGR03437 family)